MLKIWSDTTDGTSNVSKSILLSSSFWVCNSQDDIADGQKVCRDLGLFGPLASHQIVRQYNSMFACLWNLLTWYLAHNVKRGEEETKMLRAKNFRRILAVLVCKPSRFAITYLAGGVSSLQ